MNILLMGPRGCGKSTLGDRLAPRRQLVFVDLDELVQSEFDDLEVSEIFKAHGETAWRAAECRVLRAVLEDDDQVIALGGGTPMIEEVQQTLADALDRICLIFLDGPVEVLVERLRQDPGDRPSLTGAAIDEELGQMMEQRRPTYLALADAICSCGEEPVEVTLERLGGQVEAALAARPPGDVGVKPATDDDPTAACG